MIYIYDARYNIKTPTDWGKLEGITGTKKATLKPIKSKKQKLPRLDYCYIMDDETPKQQLRTWYETVKFENETWKDIDDTYKISNYGRLKKMTYKKYPEGKLMLPYTKLRYKTKLLIKIHGKEVFVHKLVAKYFVENPNNYKCVYHKNGILHDNYHANLEYATEKQVGKIGAKKQHDKPSIIAVDTYTGEIIDYFKSARDVARVLYTNRQSVLDCLNGKIEMTIGGYKFEYEEDI